MGISLATLVQLASVTVAAVLALILWDMLQGVQSRNAAIRRRLEDTAGGRPASTLPAPDGGERASGSAATTSFSRDFGVRQLHRDSGLTTPLVTVCALAAAAALVFALVLGRFGVPLAVQLAAAPIATVGFVVAALRHARKRRRTRFVEQLPNALGVVVRTLRAGHPVSAGLARVADEIGEPAAREFRELSSDVQMGLPLPLAMQRLHDRLPCPELRYLSIAIAVQTEAGGNIIDTLGTLAQSIRESTWFRKRLRSLTAEGRLTSRFLLSLPALLILMLQVLSPTYFSTILASSIWLPLLVGCCVSMTCGYLVVQRLIDIDC